MNLDRSLTGRRWVLRPSDDRLGLGIAQRHGLPEVVGRLLAGRGVDPELAEHFLQPTLLGDVTPDATFSYARDGGASQSCAESDGAPTCAPAHGGHYQVTASLSQLTLVNFL